MKHVLNLRCKKIFSTIKEEEYFFYLFFLLFKKGRNTISKW